MLSSLFCCNYMLSSYSVFFRYQSSRFLFLDHSILHYCCHHFGHSWNEASKFWPLSWLTAHCWWYFHPFYLSTPSHGQMEDLLISNYYTLKVLTRSIAKWQLRQLLICVPCCFHSIHSSNSWTPCVSNIEPWHILTTHQPCFPYFQMYISLVFALEHTLAFLSFHCTFLKKNQFLWLKPAFHPFYMCN